jgi:peroxiredoxin Q/BCP
MRGQTSVTTALLVAAFLATAAIALEVGEAAPGFQLPGSDGETYRLEDYRGKSAVVIAWFPKAFTGG